LAMLLTMFIVFRQVFEHSSINVMTSLIKHVLQLIYGQVAKTTVETS
jgi:hypothetical protein